MSAVRARAVGDEAKERRREAILAAAKRVFAKKGYHATTMADVAKALRGDLAALPAAAQKFENILLEHLKVEEPIVFPVFVDDLTRQQYLDIESKVMRSAGPGMRTFLFPWLFDGVDKRTADAAAAVTIPAPVRLAGNTVLKWRYDKLIAPVVKLGKG